MKDLNMPSLLIPQGFPHHAYCILGRPEENLPLLLEFLKKEKVLLEGNPDLILIQEDSLAIDTVRALQEKISYRSQSGGKKIAILSVRVMRNEAENALLKLTEEPPEDTHLFLLIDSREKLAITLQSRFFFVANHEKENNLDGKNFLALSTPARLEYVKKLIDAIRDEKKEKKEAIDLFDAVLHTVAQNKKKDTVSLSRILEMRNFLETPGASLKMLLESLCFLA